MENSKSFKLNKEDLKKILKGSVIAMGGAGITYVLGILDYIDVGYMTPLIVATASALLNFAQIWIRGQAQ